MSRNVNGIVFDLDGTLLDTREVIAKSLKDVISSFGVSVRHEEMMRKTHFSPYKVINEYVSIGIDEFRKRYWMLYKTNIKFSSAFRGVNELLEELRRRGYKIGVATSLPENYARSGLQVAGIEEMVDCLVTYHDTERHKPHPEPVFEAARRLGLNPQEILYIGDRPVDIKAGKGARAYTGAVTWGTSHEVIAEIFTEKPNYVFKSPRDVLDVCKEEGISLPCISAIHFWTNKNCILFEEVSDSMDFLSLSKEERRKLMNECSSCFKKVIFDIPEHCCTICCDEMEEEKYRRWGTCYWCNEKRRRGELYFEKVFAIGQERMNLDYAIKAFKGVKGSPSADLAIPLGILVASWLFEHEEELDVDMIIPVPSSDERIEEVGFDHISEILVVVRCLVDFIDINFMVLSKCKEVKLKDLGMKERERVIRGAFTIEEEEEEKEAIRGKSILILDDVFTTGATTNECARVLKENGAREVYVLAISRRYKR
ncbi:Pyrophosphatase PpaX [subsurface metagenome]|nr:HAD-IA family hydrolase [Methanosarcinales archaeon]